MITNRPLQVRNSWQSLVSPGAMVAIVEAAITYLLAQRQGLWPAAILAVWIFELWMVLPGGGVKAGDRGAAILERMPAVLMGTSVVVIIAVSPRMLTQMLLAVAYAAWRIWWSSLDAKRQSGLASLLVLQAVMFDAVFLAAAIWRHSLPEWLALGLVWAGAYLSVFAVLSRRGERTAAVMAATWALVATEVSWVLLLWLFLYTVPGGYLIVPQGAVVLTALAYCFGSIFSSQRQGSLSRARLTEYLLIGLILIAIVITGTPWRGTL